MPANTLIDVETTVALVGFSARLSRRATTSVPMSGAGMSAIVEKDAKE